MTHFDTLSRFGKIAVIVGLLALVAYLVAAMFVLCI